MTRIVLLGGGYVTLHAYANLVRRLGRAVRRGDVEIVVISADRAHRFHGFTGELVAGMVDRDRLATPLEEAMPLARIIVGRAVDIDADPPVGLVPPRRRRDRRGRCVRPPRRRHRRQGADGGGRRASRDTASPCADPDEIGALADHLANRAGLARRRRRGRCRGRRARRGDRRSRAIRSPWCTPRSRMLGEWDDQPRLVGARRGGARPPGRHRPRRAPCRGGHADRPPRCPTARVLACRTVVAATGQRPVHIPGLDRWRDERGRLRTQPHARGHARACGRRATRARVAASRDAASRCPPTPCGPSRAATTSAARSRAS